MQQTSDGRLEAGLDNNLYDDAQLIEIKIPMNLPYQTNWSAYQRCDGEVEFNNVLYKYVKRKVANDTLYVMCIPNMKKMQLESLKNDFFKNTNDLSQNNSNKSNNSKNILSKNLQNDYDGYSFSLQCVSASADLPAFWRFLKAEGIISSFHVSPEQPPETNA
jgi:hypothetical protein